MYDSNYFIVIFAASLFQALRVYSSSDTTGKLYLKRIQSVAESKKQSKIVRYPLAPHFYAKTRRKRNLLLLAKHDVRRMARKGGVNTAEGFNYNAKNNSSAWPYPCPRPTFRTTWLYRTACMDSLQVRRKVGKKRREKNVPSDHFSASTK